LRLRKTFRGFSTRFRRSRSFKNGSFEDDPFSYDGTLDLGGTNPLTGWTTVSNGTYPWGLPTPNVYNGGPTPYGNQWVIVGNYCSGGTWIEQTISTTPGQTYALSFALASEDPNGGGPALVQVSFPSGSSTPSQTFAAPLAHVHDWDTWATSTMAFQSTGSTTTIRITGLAAPGCDAGIDNVVVSQVVTG
jgi:autotransporter-associated beta strand protein